MRRPGMELLGVQFRVDPEILRSCITAGVVLSCKLKILAMGIGERRGVLLRFSTNLLRQPGQVIPRDGRIARLMVRGPAENFCAQLTILDSYLERD
jgi:hypothetical protein